MRTRKLLGSGSGGGADGNTYTRPVTKTSDYSIVQTDNMVSFNNAGAVGDVTFTLPSATGDYSFEFVLMAAFAVNVVPSGSDRIYMGQILPGGGVQISSSEQFATWRIQRAEIGKWLISSYIGDVELI